MIEIHEFAAFAIDFEGSISISTSTNKYGGLSFQPDVSIGNTSILLLRAFRERVGFGSVSINPTYSAAKAPVHYWTLLADELRTHLPLIEPYLVLKREQACLVLEALPLLRTRHSKGQRTMRSPEITDRLMRIRDELMVLNISPCFRQVLTDTQKFEIELRKRGV